MININMRCIEIVTTPFICFHFAKININMRCIEMMMIFEQLYKRGKININMRCIEMIRKQNKTLLLAD